MRADQEQRDRAAEHRKREPERVPTAAGLKAITPAYMTPEQVGDLVRRARTNTVAASVVIGRMARARRELQGRIDRRRSGAAIAGSLRPRAAARL